MFGGTKFNADTDIPDLSGKVFLVTGGKRAIPQGKRVSFNFLCFFCFSELLGWEVDTPMPGTK